MISAEAGVAVFFSLLQVAFLFLLRDWYTTLKTNVEKASEGVAAMRLELAKITGRLDNHQWQIGDLKQGHGVLSNATEDVRKDVNQAWQKIRTIESTLNH